MASVKAGLGGKGAVTSIESSRHPDSHFEMASMNIKKADDGSFVVEHRMQLKKKHDGKNDGMVGSWREPEVHTAASKEDLMAHVGKHFGFKKSLPKDADA